MAIDPRDYIENDKRIPVSMTGDAGKVLTVSASEEVYEHSSTTSLTGEIIMWVLDTPPTGYLMCDGSTYDVDDYPELGVLLGGVSGGSFDVPEVNFAKNSLGSDTNTTEPADVGTHGHTVDAIADHTHPLTVTSVADHAHTLSIAAAPAHTHATGDGGSTSYTVVSSAATRDITSYTGTATGSAGAHAHTGSAANNGAHTHTATATDAGGVTPVVQNHTGTNQPYCTLLNFCIRT